MQSFERHALGPPSSELEPLSGSVKGGKVNGGAPPSSPPPDEDASTPTVASSEAASEEAAGVPPLLPLPPPLPPPLLPLLPPEVESSPGGCKPPPAGSPEPEDEPLGAERGLGDEDPLALQPAATTMAASPISQGRTTPVSVVCRSRLTAEKVTERADRRYLPPAQ
jgi:hypothetical protein